MRVCNTKHRAARELPGGPLASVPQRGAAAGYRGFAAASPPASGSSSKNRIASR